MKYITILIALFFVYGCANNVYSWSYSTINRAYQDELLTISIGMSKSEVVDVFNGKILPRGQKDVNGSIIEALELQHNYWSGVGGRLISDKMWFYFYDNKLIKWGYPDDWPESPDIIIEKRIKNY